MSEAIKNTATQGAEQAAGTAATSTPAVTPEATEKPTGANAGVYTHKFKRPFEYCGKAYKEIIFDFESLAGRDMVAISTEMQNSGEILTTAEFSPGFQYRMAARAAGIGSDVLEAMPLSDFNRITSAARSFLINTGY